VYALAMVRKSRWSARSSDASIVTGDDSGELGRRARLCFVAFAFILRGNQFAPWRLNEAEDAFFAVNNY
jgi:hypothetical protein